MQCLRTFWFGSFIFNNKAVVDASIFNKNIDELVEKLTLIRANCILPEEEALATQYDVSVFEHRLASLGVLITNNSLKDMPWLNAEDHGFDLRLFHDVMIAFSKKQISKGLALPDYRVIQMINAMDDLQQTSNLLKERLLNWGIFPMDESIVNSLSVLINQVDDEIIVLRTQIQKEMHQLAPNTSKIVGSFLTARLLAHAGSLQKLACLPASSIQLLGAEKALFRYKKEGGRPPKHGSIYQHPYLNKAPRKLRGKIARMIAASIALAIKADVFTKHDISGEIADDLHKKIQMISNNKK